jgi:hypothetical protein
MPQRETCAEIDGPLGVNLLRADAGAPVAGRLNQFLERLASGQSQLALVRLCFECVERFDLLPLQIIADR